MGREAHRSPMTGAENDGSLLVWGPFRIHPAYATEHFLVAGTTGSGKTVLVNMLMKSALRSGLRRRALIYDSKQEVIPLLDGMGLRPRTRLLHPFDQRGSAWDMAKDITGPLSARQVAAILVPSQDVVGESGSFFIDAVRDLLTGVFLAFIRCMPNKGSWTFRDVVLAMLYEPYLRAILGLGKTNSLPMLSRLHHSYVEGADERTWANIRATVSTKIAPYESIAAAWHSAMTDATRPEADRSFSITEWLDDASWDSDGFRSILVLGNDETARTALDAVNAALFQRLTELMVSRREQTREEKAAGENLTWVFLDEVRDAGNLNGLSRLMTKGRSKGVCTVLAFQDIDGLRAVYGQEIAHEITGQCNTVAILKLNSPSTAEWGADLFGSYLARESVLSESISPEGVSYSVAESRQERSVLYTRDLIYLPPTNLENGLTGFFRHKKSKRDDPLLFRLNWEQHVQEHLLSPGSWGNHEPRKEAEHYLAPWGPEDWARLGLPGNPPEPYAEQNSDRDDKTDTSSTPQTQANGKQRDFRS